MPMPGVKVGVRHPRTGTVATLGETLTLGFGVCLPFLLTPIFELRLLYLVTSEDGLEHGLFIDNNNSQIEIGTDFSGPTTTTSTTFSLDATRAGSFWYYCSIHSGPPYRWDSSVMRGRWIVNPPVQDTAPPTVASVAASPSQQQVGGIVTISAIVTDNVAVASVSAHVVGPSTDANLTMANPSGSTWTVQRTFSATGTYTFAVWATDTSGNFASGAGTFAIQDMTPPTIASVAATPTSQVPKGEVNLTAQVTDNGGLTSVNVHVTGPAFDMNLTMALATGSTWFVNRTFAPVGSYAFTVWAVDAAGNAASKTGSFSIAQAPPPSADYTIWIVLAGVIAIVALALLVVMRRRTS